MAASTSRGSHAVALSESEADEVDSTNARKNVQWNIEMDTCMTEALIEQMHKGNKIDRSFKNSAYEATCEVLSAKLSVKVTINHVKNRLKTLKKDMGAFQDMEKFGSGFVFNKITGMMDANPKVWDVYLQAHPSAMNYRHKKVPCFENLMLLFGNDRARVHHATTTKERPIILERETNKADLVFLGDKEKTLKTNGEFSDPTNKTKDISNTFSEVPSSPRGSLKRKAGANGGSSLHEEFKIIWSSLDSVPTAYGQSSPRVIPEDELFKEVEKIEGLDEDEQLLAYDFICGDVIRGRTFVGLPIHRRKRWLEMKLGRDFGCR